MSSIVFNSPSPETNNSNNSTKGTVDNLINKIMGSVNPKDTFNKMVGSDPKMSNAMNLINQYGNGDPKTAFMNYAQQMGKTAVADSIMAQLGLK